jgi:murein DD-endopeptidase MepM/ murein hydrolase activator NlpD
MPLTNTRTPATMYHASSGTLLSTRTVRWLAAACTLLVGASVAHAAPVAIDRPAEVSLQAERIFTSGDGLLFPIDPIPVCEVFDNFAGFSKSFGTGGHEGTDIGADLNQEVYAVEDGILYRSFSGATSGLGWGLLGDSDTKYRYFHLATMGDGLSVGDRVARGQVIGSVGDTGNATPGGWHLHFEVRPGPEPHAIPVDPVPLLDIPRICNVH